MVRFTASLAAITALTVLAAACGGSDRQSPSADTDQRGQSGAFPPRTVDGQPDIQGVWAGDTCRGAASPCPPSYLEPAVYLRTIGLPENHGVRPVSGSLPPGATGTSFVNPMRDMASAIVDPPDHVLPYQPWAKTRRDAVMKNYLRPSPAQVDTNSRGWPSGVPRENYYTSPDGSVGGPVQILQPPGYVVFLYENHHEFRIVPLDGRPHLGQGIALWMGDSRGSWEGNTLVVDVTNSNDSARFSAIGDFHSDAMHMTERWTFIDADTLDYKATIDDPKVFTRPWTLGIPLTRTPPGTELVEYAGVEGEVSIERHLDEGAPRSASASGR